jgi:RNA polymerase sigma factor (sigma-70 family)
MPNEAPQPQDPVPAGEALLERVVAEHRLPLTRYAARLLGDAEKARDVVQDTFIRFMVHSNRDTDGHAVEWLFTVCRNRALDALRKDGRMKLLADGEMERIAGTEPHPGRALESAETRRLILELVGQLPANQQEVVRLKFQNGFSYKEIARITELSVSNVGFLIHTAVARLRRDWAVREGEGGTGASKHE